MVVPDREQDKKRKIIGQSPKKTSFCDKIEPSEKARLSNRAFFMSKRRQRPCRRIAELTEGRTKERKRHIVVDTICNLLAVITHAANIHDTKSGILAASNAFRKYLSNGFVPMTDTEKPLSKM
ncbi:MAG: hypothetical protein K2L38_11990, partial [Dysosmobacter sp.]|nr:hypothetical protein [Dysosmobacter sp.]